MLGNMQNRNLTDKLEDSPCCQRQATLPSIPGEGNGGARRDRTDDLMLAKHALSQLSYGPF
jgi:hypothetical protein